MGVKFATPIFDGATLDDMNEKLENLRLFLREGIVLKGWNVYKEINLKFKNQIVCVKR